VAGVDASGRVTKHVNCQISGAVPKKGGVAFDYLANSLPFPVDTVSRLWENPHKQSEAVGVMPFYSAFNREILKVGGLRSGQYEVRMDGKTIGTWSADSLDEGINLAAVSATPEYQQAVTVMLLNEDRMALESRLRAYYWLQFDYFRDLHRMYKDEQVDLDSVNSAASKRWDVASKRDNYRAARYPEIRKAWQRQMDFIVDEIYTLNQPRTHRVEVVPLGQ
jgi:hypothetical protein